MEECQPRSSWTYSPNDLSNKANWVQMSICIKTIIHYGEIYSLVMNKITFCFLISLEFFLEGLGMHFMDVIKPY